MHNGEATKYDAYKATAANNSTMFGSRRLLSICTVARRPLVPYRYSLQNKPNISNIRSWEIYVDFMSICASGDIRLMNIFHDKHVLCYETRLRKEDPELIFRDSVLYSPSNPDASLVRIAAPVYPRLMGAVEEILHERRAPEKTLSWFHKIRQLR